MAKNKKDKLNPKQALFLKNLSKGKTGTQSAIDAGYSPNSAYSQSSRLLKNAKISKCLDDAGLSDKRIAEGIAVNAQAGMAVKATADTSLRALELASRLKGYLAPDKADVTQQFTQVNIRELRVMSNEQLQERLSLLTGEISSLSK